MHDVIYEGPFTVYSAGFFQWFQKCCIYLEKIVKKMKIFTYLYKFKSRWFWTMKVNKER